jgi:hypothetical protein
MMTVVSGNLGWLGGVSLRESLPLVSRGFAADLGGDTTRVPAPAHYLHPLMEHQRS